MSFIKVMAIFYIIIATCIGTLVIVHFASTVLYNSSAPAPMPISLSNGFIYAPNWEAEGANHHITDKNGNEIVEIDVKEIMWNEDYIYGYRTGHANEVYYFVCEYGKDCSKTQHLSDTEFNSSIARYKLPQFVKWESKRYQQLLHEVEINPKLKVVSKGG